ncbi:adenine nucleotide alpha hydrolases-like protein [Eremomyces bilateralis CBS 781.70]|uniref:Cytoplasmic tRNA 2-thiolation protein 1 n=1 Tax=Eremomyces bilateralis CBS 781.70 TaxID=1392243 RepID=A0A6G1G342_9PEZI|nr:adenine nucleotide alpha hydrolases-like protein [Eremomyces bilateralis CBS 781.70]KAF1812340.1 adenine nucleotide alpha hydrolases-like protein [Eremomyces bilateralis CBS 781.70]
MPPSICALCTANRAVILRPKNHQKLCKPCFLITFEDEIHETITSNNLFRRGERVAIGASGGKDSTVLASVMKTLNDRHDYGLDLVLLSIDEGIKGYRDDSLDTVRQNARDYEMPLMILGYDELYGWTMDQVVEQVGKKGNCTYCGVFRRQALDRGAARLGVQHVVTGHNADDMAETVMMNLLRGDLARLSRTTSIITSTPSAAPEAKAATTEGGLPSITTIKRSKPLKYAYEKEIVLYAHHKSLLYFSTECIYSPEAFRGSARALIKNLERIRPSSIVDVIKSGEDMARLVPGNEDACANDCATNASATAAEDEVQGCGSAGGKSSESMAKMEARLRENAKAEENGLETEITSVTVEMNSLKLPNGKNKASRASDSQPRRKKKVTQQVMGTCERCGYLSSQSICKACVLLEGLNKSRPKAEIGIS